MQNLITPKRLDLRRVTLIAASAVAIPQTCMAMKACLRIADFGGVRFFGPETDFEWPNDIAFHRRVAFASRHEYSEFIVRELADCFETEFALVVQWDGYAVDSSAWDDRFFEFDYLGAVWPQFSDGHNVGNGGFSLRSRRLQLACKDPRIVVDGPEDAVICRANRVLLEEEYAIRFADASTARAFSYERESRCHSFGFHGVFNMPELLEGDFVGYYRSLPGDLVGSRENSDLLGSAVRNGQFWLAFSILMRERAQRGWFSGVVKSIFSVFKSYFR